MICLGSQERRGFALGLLLRICELSLPPGLAPGVARESKPNVIGLRPIASAYLFPMIHWR